MSRSFAVCRPYSTRFRKRVFTFLLELGYELRPGSNLIAGTPDDAAARWLAKQDVDLLLLPFHLHRSAEGATLDGVGVALLLPERFDMERSPILMPVSKYSWEASYHRRFSVLKEERPTLAKRIVAMQEHEVGSPHIVRALGARFSDRRGNEAHSPSLKNFPKTSAMSGSFQAVDASEEELPSDSWRTDSKAKESASWRTNSDTPSSSWRTQQSTDRPASSGARPTEKYESERRIPIAERRRKK